MIFLILLLLISNAWVLLLVPRNWEKFSAVARSFRIAFTFLVVWWTVTFTATGWMLATVAKASAPTPLHSTEPMHFEVKNGKCCRWILSYG